jgi:cytoskeletal protein RodZ
MKRSKNLTEIATETRISRRYLEAIEADNVSDLPGDFFYKAFIRQYARVLQLDERTTQQILAAAVSIPEPDPVPALNLVYERAQHGASTRWRPSTGVAVGLLIAVLAGGSGLYALWQRFQTRAEEPAGTASYTPVPAPAERLVVRPPETTNPPPADPAVAPVAGTLSEQPAPQVPTSVSETPAAQAVAVSEGQVSVEITTTEAAWVQVSSEGKTIFAGTIKPNQSRSFAVGPTGRLRTGNAGAVDVRMNGKPIGVLGPKGQVRAVLFKAGEAQIVTPQPIDTSETQLFGVPRTQN